MITAITVNYQTIDYLEKLLIKLEAEELIQEIIVVDNSAEPELDRISKKQSKKIQTIINRKNLGLAQAVNQAASLASCPYILLINPDVIPLENSIPHLFEQAEKWSASLAGPRFFLDEGRHFRMPPSEGLFLFWKFAHESARKYAIEAKLLSFYWQIRHERFWQAKHPLFEPFLGGACLLIKRDEFHSQKLLDERFFLYFEETDLCLKSNKAGLRILLVPQSEMIHFWSQSPAPDISKEKLRAAAAQTLMEKHFPGLAIPVLPDPNTASEELSIQDLGVADQLPELEIPPVQDSVLYLEMGNNPYFVPFAQASVSPDSEYSFPEEIWERIEAREYFIRVRGEISGTVKIWRFLKP